jgi:hypothetical protein
MESIRLTNDEFIDQLTFDKSDSFYWLKEQARRGVASAQVIDIILKLINSKPSLQFSKD